MSSSVARRLLEATSGEHPIISLVFDLNPSEFATASARETQAHSLMDGVHNLVEADASLGHDGLVAARADVARLREYLVSDELPVSGAGALAIFCSSLDDLFETIVLAESSPSEGYFERAPHLEAVVTAPVAQGWCAVLVSVDSVELVFGTGARALRRDSGSDYVRGHSQSDGNDERSRAQDIDGHLIEVARLLARDFQRHQFDVLLVAGPTEAQTGLVDRLGDDLRRVLVPGLEVDPSAASESDIATAVETVLAGRATTTSHDVLAEFVDQLAAGDRSESGRRAVGGVAAVLEALTEQRVASVLIAGDFHAAGARCPQCGLLLPYEVDVCPVDGTSTAPVEDLREPIIAAAVRQDADVRVLPEPPDALGTSGEPVGALLRF